MGVTNNYNLTGTGNSSLNPASYSGNNGFFNINQTPNGLINLQSPNPASYSGNNELISNIINQMPTSPAENTFNSLVSSSNSFLQNDQNWLNGYEYDNNLPITQPTTSIGNEISGVLSGLANLTNAVGGVFAIKNGIATGYSQPYINGQPTTYNRINQQPINPLTGQPISATQFPIKSVLIIGGLVIAGVLVMELI